MPTNTNGQLFDLKQRGDGAWAVWVRKSPADLGLVSRADVERARNEAFTDEGWAEFLKQPHLSEPSVSVIAEIYPARPSVDAVLDRLGVKRKPRVEGAQRKERKPRPDQTKRAAEPALQAVA